MIKCVQFQKQKEPINRLLSCLLFRPVAVSLLAMFELQKLNNKQQKNKQSKKKQKKKKRVFCEITKQVLSPRGWSLSSVPQQTQRHERTS